MQGDQLYNQIISAQIMGMGLETEVKEDNDFQSLNNEGNVCPLF